MSVTVTEADTYPTSLEVPSDGEQANQSGLLGTFLQDLTDRTNFIMKRLRGGNVDQRFALELMNGSQRNPNTPDWIPDVAVYGGWTQNDVGGAGRELYWSVPHMPASVLLKEVRVQIIGDSHSSLPAQQPTLKVFEANLSGGSVSALGTLQDTAASVGAYETLHNLEITGLSKDLSDTTKKYIIELEGEYSTNAVQFGLYVLAVEIVTTRP